MMFLRWAIPACQEIMSVEMNFPMEKLHAESIVKRAGQWYSRVCPLCLVANIQACSGAGRHHHYQRASNNL